MLRDLVLLSVLAVSGWGTTWAQNGPIVQVEQGGLRGKQMTSVLGKTYYSFQGIPYAKPPVGALRYKDTQEPEAWNDTRDATKEGCVCMQLDRNDWEYKGCEDCLFLNVYTTMLPSSQSVIKRESARKSEKCLPVMFWIHGGGFVFGSGNTNDYGPDFLVSKDVIVVTINYRLGSFGFLRRSKQAAGNVGLKDQVWALRWVQKNIHAFNGDPNKVTIFGESAGGVSVHWHMLSPMSKGLFSGGIAQSGAATNPWAIQREPHETAQRLARAVGCTDGDDDKDVECMRGVDALVLLKASEEQAPIHSDRDRLMFFPFPPTVEEEKVNGVETFATAHPQKLMEEGCLNDVPFMTGINNEEWMYTVALNNSIFASQENLNTLDAGWKTFVLPETHFPDDCDVSQAMQDVRTFSIDATSLTFANLPGYKNMVADLQFAEGVYNSVKYMAKKKTTKTFLYSFIVDEELNFLKNLYKMPYPGASHGDDLGYLYLSHVSKNVSSDSPAYISRQRMVRMWTNFAKYGNPTQKDDPLIGVKWKPFTLKEKNFLEIGQELKPGKDLNKKRVDFWECIYEKYGRKGNLRSVWNSIITSYKSICRSSFAC